MNIMDKYRQELRQYLQRGSLEFEKENRDFDGKVTFAFRKFPENKEWTEIRFKVAIVNDFYGTGVPSRDKMADHILRRRIDARLRKGDVRLVDSLRSGHRIRGGRDFYVFATKYCHFSQPTKFPIYDSIVSRTLVRVDRALGLRSALGFRPTVERLRASYPRFKLNLDLLLEGLRLGVRWKYKRLDEGLYYLGLALGLGRGLGDDGQFVRASVGPAPKWI